MLVALLIMQVATGMPTATQSRIGQTTDRLAERMNAILNAPNPPGPHEVLDKNLIKFRGKSAQYAFDRLGYPDRKMLIGRTTIYSWVNNDTNRDGSALTCTVKIAVRAAKIITADHHGNAGACSRYAHAVDPAFRERY